jgi:hypothetical protein
MKESNSHAGSSTTCAFYRSRRRRGSCRSGRFIADSSRSFDGTVTKVTYTPQAAITGANTNSRTLSLVNTRADGSGAAIVASLALISGVNGVASVELPLTLSGTPANLTVAAGDMLEFKSTHVGTGIADPGGLVTVDLSRS